MSPIPRQPIRVCLACGYPLANVEPGRCTECGRPFDPADPRTVLLRPPGSVSGRRVVFACIILGVVVVLVMRWSGIL